MCRSIEKALTYIDVKTDPNLPNLDFVGLSKAIAERVPKQTAYQMACSNLDFEAQEINAAVQKIPSQCHACDWIGEFTARFRLDGASAIPVEIQFKPSDTH